MKLQLDKDDLFELKSIIDSAINLSNSTVIAEVHDRPDAIRVSFQRTENGKLLEGRDFTYLKFRKE